MRLIKQGVVRNVSNEFRIRQLKSLGFKEVAQKQAAPKSTPKSDSK